MIKSKISILKWIASILIIILALYILFWIGVVVTIANSVNKSANKPFNISEQATIKFKTAKSSGFPFKFAIAFHEVVEENNTTIIRHSSPIIIGYNLITQSLYSHYKGESIAKYKPVESGFGSKVIGEYKIHANMPLSATIFKVLLLKKHPFEIVNYINNLNLSSKNVQIYDLIDNALQVGQANLHFNLRVKHHQYYTSLQELLNSIPKDYSVKLYADSQNTNTFKNTIPFSLVYWNYLPINFKYSFDVDIHTEAKQFNLDDIMNDISIKTNQLDFSNDMQSSNSYLNLKRLFLKETGDSNFNINYNSKIKFNTGFSKYLANSFQLWSDAMPNDGPLAFAKEFMTQLHIGNINLDTKDTPIILAAEITTSSNAKKNIELDVKNLSLSFENAGINLKANITNNFEAEWLKGVIEIVEWPKVINYLTRSYFAIYNTVNYGILNEDFLVNLYRDFLESIANNINKDTSNLTFKFSIVKDFNQSKIGRFTWAETSLLYYSKLFEHILAISKDREEAIKKFRMVIPTYINDPKIFDEVTKIK